MSVIILDDRDSSIQYEGDWSKGGDPDMEYLGTTMYCTPASGTATLKFIGTGVAVFGTLQASYAQISSYELDGDVTKFRGQDESYTRFSQQFFSIDNLTLSRHTLVATPVRGTLLIDYITVQVPSMTGGGNANAETITTATTIFETVTTSTINGTTPITITQNLTTTATAEAQTPSPSRDQTDSKVNEDTKTNNHMRPVMGGALGGLGALLLMLFAYLFIRRRKTKKASKPRLSATPYHLAVPNSRSTGDDLIDLAGSISSNIAQHDSERRQSANLAPKRTSRRESTRVITRAPSPPPIYQSEMGVENHVIQ